ncbi:MAG: hypothetical protein IPM83_15570 [Ignavibacteria bacterium]|nr:hypothetical protein [Ignavibacteria bacterium]
MSVLLDPMLGRVPAPSPSLAETDTARAPIEIEGYARKIDVVDLPTDHYDHLDHGSVLRLLPKVKHPVVCLGVARHLIRWGVSPSNIIELDWHEAVRIKDVHHLYTCPTFLGRGFWDRHKSLWSSWVISSPRHTHLLQCR